MATAIPPLKESEKIEFGYSQSGKQPEPRHTEITSTLVVASYNIRYAVGRFLISGGLLRKAGLSRLRRRDEQVVRKAVCCRALMWLLSRKPTKKPSGPADTMWHEN